MKNANKKGFTLVELVIVIAVIAILAGVLIGTFATVISRANQSKAVQEWKAAVDEAYVEYVAENHVVPATVKVEGKTIVFGGDYTMTNDGALVDGYLLLNDDVYVELDKTYGVYFNWDNETKGSTYSVATTKISEKAATFDKSIVEAYVEARLASAVAGANTISVNQKTISFTKEDGDGNFSTGESITLESGTYGITISGKEATVTGPNT